MKISPTKLLLHLEGLALLTGAVAAYAYLGYGWIRFAVLLLAPDLAMLGFLAGRRVGVACYNAVHTYLAPAILGGILIVAHQTHLGWLPLIWVAHIGLDRVCGYGLKNTMDLKRTHLQAV